MRIPDLLLAVFPPSKDLLLDCACQKTDDAMLWEIAKADYGLQADEMMVELRAIRDTRDVPLPLSWMLGEVLTLTHYSDPDVPMVPPFQPGPTGLRGHQTRLFACAVLLHVEGELPRESRMVTDSALARCLVSAMVLDDEIREAVACYLTWWIARHEMESDMLFFALGILCLASRLRFERFKERDLGAIAEWVLAIESLECSRYSSYLAGPRPPAFSVHAGFWEPIAAELLSQAKSIRDVNMRTNLELCTLLVDSTSR